MSRRSVPFALQSIVVLLGAIGIAQAQGLPSVIADQVGATLEQADGRMVQNGFTKTAQRPPRYFYWNGASCAALTLRDSRVASVSPASAVDCEQVQGQPHVTRPGRAGGIGGLSNAPTPNRDMPGRRPGGAQSPEYDRGFQDGATGGAMRNGRRSDDYARGYSEGARQYRPDARPGRGNDANRYLISASDLEGMPARSAADSLIGRGFRSVDRGEGRRGRQSVWFNERSRQCIVANVRGGVYRNVDNVDESRCR